MRVLIDTNVIISGTFWSGKPKRLLNTARRGEITYITSKTLLEELRETLTDPEKPFQLNEKETEKVVRNLRTFAILISPTSQVSVCRDEDDNRVLECAMDGEASYIVTGDKDLLDLKSFEGIKIAKVSDFLQLHELSDPGI